MRTAVGISIGHDDELEVVAVLQEIVEKSRISVPEEA